MTITRRTGLIAGAFLLATASLAQAADWPVDPITFMVTTPTGGSEDRLVRTLAPYLAEELGVPVVVENIDGAQGILGADRLLRQGGDGSLIASSTIARLIGHIQAGRTSFQLADFEFLNVPDDEYALVVATSAATFDNAEGLVDSLTSGAAPIMADPTGTGPAIMMTIFLEKLKVAPDAYRAVTYTGGGPLVAAIMGGQVDFSSLPDQALGRLENVKPLLVFRDERAPDLPDVPTANEVLAAHGETMPSMNTGLRAFLAPASLKTEHPERFRILTEAMQRVYENPETVAAFKKARVGTNWLGPDKSRELIDGFAANFGPYLGN